MPLAQERSVIESLGLFETENFPTLDVFDSEDDYTCGPHITQRVGQCDGEVVIQSDGVSSCVKEDGVIVEPSA